MRIAYFVHDLHDAAVAKRIFMLTSAGAEVMLFGFTRGAKEVDEAPGQSIVHLGRTDDAQLVRRAATVARNLACAPGWGRHMAGTDVVLARNLEALVLAAAARRLHAPAARLAYECLDVHRLMLGRGPAGRVLRALEGGLLSASDLLIVSSPAFMSEYFEPLQKVGTRPRLASLIVENKALVPDDASLAEPRPPPVGRAPWRIGWFGMIRCRRSLDLLIALARKRPDLVQIDIRGRPSYTEFVDFDRQVAEAPNVSFGGSYQVGDLPDLYSQVHFNWVIDYFQDEGNSRWLLPNRLYEGGSRGVPPLARTGCETGRWLERRDLGVLFQNPGDELEAFLDALTPQGYAQIASRHAHAPRDYFVLEPADCQGLAAALAGPPAAYGGRQVEALAVVGGA